MTVAFRLLLFLLIMAPLAFGSVELWSVTAVESVAFGATLFLLGDRLFHKNSTFYLPPGMIFLILFLVYFLMQLVPLPLHVVKYLSPAAYELAMSTVGRVHEISMLPLSVNRQATLAEFFRFASYGCVYFLTVQLLTRRKLLKTTIKIVVVLGSFIALEAILQKATAARLIYWFRSVPLNAIQPMGPYVYHNHFAGLMEMVCPLAIGLFFAVRPQLAEEHSVRRKIVDFLNNPALNTHMLAGGGAVLIAVSIFVSLSRGGMLSLAGGLLCLVFLLHRFMGSSKNKMSFLLVPALIIIVVGWFGWDMIFERFYEAYAPETGGIEDGRFIVWQDTLSIIKDYWLTGTGLGTFLDTYPLYRTVGGGIVFDHAHNDYLELFATTGVIGFTLVGFFLATIVWRSFTLLRQRNETYAICMASASLAGICAIMLHSITDFNFYSAAANGLYFFFLCGLLVSASHTSQKSGGRRSVLPVVRMPAFSNAGMISIACLLVGSLVFNIGGMQAGRIFDSMKEMDLSSASGMELGELAEQARKMIRSAPWEAKYSFAAGNINFYAQNRQQAFLNYLRAVELNPSDSDSVQRLGIAADMIGKENGQELILKGALLAPRNFMSYKQTALWLLHKKRNKEASEAIRHAILEDSSKVQDCIQIMERYGLSTSEMQSAIPEMVGPLLHFAAYLKKSDKPSQADEVYAIAANLLSSETEVQSWHFSHLFWYLVGQKNYQRALTIILQGVKLFPEDAGLHMQLGDAYRQTDNFSDAKKAYLQAISLDGDFIDARIKLGEIFANEQGYDAAASYYDAAFDRLSYGKKATPSQFISLVDFYLKYEKWSRAGAVAQRGTEMFPESLYLQVRLGNVYRKTDKRIRADEAYSRAWKLMSQGVDARDWMVRDVAWYFYQKSQDERAQQVLEKGLALYPGDIQLLVMQGNLFSRSGEDAAALEVFQKVLALEPENKTAVRMIQKLSSGPLKSY